MLAGSLHLPPILPHGDALYALLRPLHTALAFLLFATFLVHLSAGLRGPEEDAQHAKRIVGAALRGVSEGDDRLECFVVVGKPSRPAAVALDASMSGR